MTDQPVPVDEEGPLSERFPIYLRLFGIGALACIGLGGAVGLFTQASTWNAIAYSFVALAVVLMLAGGATGGGYTNLGAGAFAGMFGGRDIDEEGDGSGNRQPPSLDERLQKGLRPGPNPRAFWQVIAGVLYLAIAVVIFFAVA